MTTELTGRVRSMHEISWGGVEDNDGNGYECSELRNRGKKQGLYGTMNTDKAKTTAVI